MKRINKILCGLIIITLSLPNSVFAMGSEDIEKMNNEEKIIMQYVYLDDDGIPVYEKERALADGISESIIEVADNYFEILNQYYAYENGNKTRMSVPIYGNWCGPGYGSGTPIDLLDIGCRSHDWCYGKRGYYKCSCDQELAAYIDRNIGNMSGTQYVMAQAVRLWARNKGNNVDPKGEGGPFSCRL